MKRYIGVKEASKLLGVSTNTVYKYINEGKLSFKRIGKGRIKILYKDVLPYINQDSPTNLASETKKAESEIIPIQSQKISTQEESPSDMVSPENNDIVFYRIFKTLFLVGAGVIYIFFANLSLIPTNFIDESLGRLLIKLLPYCLVLAGILSSLSIFNEEKFAKIRNISHIYTSLVLGLYSYFCLVLGNYGLFVFTASILFVTLEHFVRGFSGKVSSVSFRKSYLRYSFILVIIGGIVVISHPEFFPISIFTDYIYSNKSVAAFIWYVVFTPILIYLLSPAGSNSKIIVPFFVIGGLAGMIIGTYLTLTSTWDTAYFSFLTGIFCIFLAGWSLLNSNIDIKRFYIIIASFLWVGTSLILGLFALHITQKDLRDKAVVSLEAELNQISAELESTFSIQKATMLKESANSEILNTLETKDQEKAIGIAKRIYDSTPNVLGVLIFNEEGVAVGVYPRDSLIQGTNFSSRQYFHRTKDTYQATISDVFENIKNTYTVIQTEPIFKNNKFAGMIGVASNLDKLSEVYSASYKTYYDIYALDSQGNYVFSGNKEKIGKKFEENTKLSTQEYISLKKNMGTTVSWDLYIAYPVSMSYEQLSSASTLIALFFFINSMVSIGASILISSKLPSLDGKLIKIPRGGNFQILSGLN